MTKSTLALCVPAYNAAEFLPRLLNSARKQSIKFDEILVYDDASTDATVLVAQEYGAKVITGDVNRGCSYSKNQLAEVATCDWIHFHDADDELLPNFTTLAHKWMSSAQPPDVVLFDYEYRDNDSGELLSVKHFNKDFLEKDPISYAIRRQINPFCGLYRRKEFWRVGGYDLDPLVLYNEDVAFHCHLAICGLRFSSESEVSIINYRVKKSMSSSVSIVKCVQAQYYVMKKNALRLGQRYKKEIAEQLWKIAGVAASFLDWKTAYDSVALAVKLNGRVPQHASAIFKGLCLINPFFAVKYRENMIRKFKPHLRLNRV